MNLRKRTLRACAAIGALLAAIAIAACGGGSKDAMQLLRESFQGSHSIKSGQVNFRISVTPSGSRSLTSPISFKLSGPFQNLGAGKLPQSDFALSVSFQGHTGSLGIISTGTSGFVSLQGLNYRLPQSTFQRLEQSFASASGGGGGASTLGKLGLDPLHWLNNPSVVGGEDVAGTPTIHVHAGINVSAFLSDLNTALPKLAAQAGTAGLPTSISASTISRLATVIQNPSFDVWTGKDDKTIRRVQINLTIPVTGQLSTLLGGLNSAAIGLSIEYDHLNEPQTITAPTSAQPYAQFQTKLRGLVTQIRSSLSGLASGSASGGSGGASLVPGGSTTPGGSSGGGNLQAYSQCIQQANGDVGKMQQCASLLSGH